MTRRPLCFLAAAFALGILTRYLTGQSAAAGCAAGGVLFVLLYLAACTENKADRHRLALLLAAVLLAGGAVMQLAVQEAASDPYAARAGETARITGMVLACEEDPEGGLRMIIRTDDGSRLSAAFDGELGTKTAEGCRISGIGDLSLPAPARNPGCFDYALYLKGRRIYACIRLEKAELGGIVCRWRWLFADMRQILQDALADYLNDEQQAVLTAMLFGDKSLLEEDTYARFQRNGTAHVLAVSGLHVGMLYGLYCWVLGRRRTGGSCLVLGILLLCYAALSGFSPSVIRAGTMIGIHTCGRMLHDRYDMLTGIALSGAMILAVSPFQLFQSGFLLSYLAVLLLAFVHPVFIKRFQPALLAWLRRKGASVRTAECAGTLLSWLGPLFVMQWSMVPLTAFLFNYVSAGAFLANLPLVLLAGMIVPAGILLLLLLMLPFGGLFVPLGGMVLSGLLRLLLQWNRLSYMEGALTSDVVSPPRFAVLLFYGLLFLFLSEWMQIRLVRKDWKRAAAALALVFCAVLTCAASLDNGFGSAEIIFVDVGQGACVHMRCGKDADILFDGGGRPAFDVGSKIVRPYLLKNGVRSVDAAFVTHLDTDHYGGIVSLCRAGMVERLIVSRELADDLPSIIRDTGLAEENILLAGPGDVFRFEQVCVTCLGPVTKTGSENELSMVLLAEGYGRRLLITGDIGADTEKELVSFYGASALRADILQIPHHGSRFSTSAALLDAVRPRAAVAQVGVNHYGHPAAEVIERCEEKGIPFFRNDRNGAVGIDLDGMRLLTMLRSGQREDAVERTDKR